MLCYHAGYGKQGIGEERGNMREAYLDNSATTRCFPEVVELMNKIYLEEYGNPSSMHHKGVEAERQIAEAKKTLAQILKVSEKNLLFTSCGTESDNIAIIGGAMANMRKGRHLRYNRRRYGQYEKGTPPDHDENRASRCPGIHEIS